MRHFLRYPIMDGRVGAFNQKYDYTISDENFRITSD